jgi:hypothetical protein
MNPEQSVAVRSWDGASNWPQPRDHSAAAAVRGGVAFERELLHVLFPHQLHSLIRFGVLADCDDLGCNHIPNSRYMLRSEPSHESTDQTGPDFWD